MKSSIALLSFFFLPLLLSAQSNKMSCQAAVKPYSNCAAIYYNNNMLVDDFSPQGKCKLENGMRGKLSVSAVSLSKFTAWPTQAVGFKVAIRNTDSNTLWMYSEETFYEVNLEDILTKCQPGDKIIFLTVDKEFTLPHHEIEIVWEC